MWCRRLVSSEETLGQGSPSKEVLSLVELGTTEVPLGPRRRTDLNLFWYGG